MNRNRPPPARSRPRHPKPTEPPSTPFSGSRPCLPLFSSAQTRTDCPGIHIRMPGGSLLHSSWRPHEQLAVRTCRNLPSHLAEKGTGGGREVLHCSRKSIGKSHESPKVCFIESRALWMLRPRQQFDYPIHLHTAGHKQRVHSPLRVCLHSSTSASMHRQQRNYREQAFPPRTAAPWHALTKAGTHDRSCLGHTSDTYLTQCYTAMELRAFLLGALPERRRNTTKIVAVTMRDTNAPPKQRLSPNDAVCGAW